MSKYQEHLSHLTRADHDFGLINEGDKIAVGLSGGKDSLTLLTLLKDYQKLKNFELIAITVDGTGGKADFSGLIEYCKSLEIKYIIEPSDIFEILFNVRKESNPCSLCSKLRRGMLNSAAKREGFNKVALGHHGDDLVETFLLSFTHEGRLSTFAPKLYMDRADVTLIRPLIYFTEQQTIKISKNMPILNNPCPINHKTRREYMKTLVSKLEKDLPGARERMLDAITKPERYNLLDKTNIKC